MTVWIDLKKQENRGLAFSGLSSEQNALKTVTRLIVLYLGSLFVAAVITGPVFSFFQWIARETGSSFFVYLADHTFDEFFDRIRIVFIVLGLPWLLKTFNLFLMTSSGLRVDRPNLIGFMIWFGTGVIMVVMIIVGQEIFTPVKLRPDTDFITWITVLGASLLSGLAVALFEEIVFRGIVFKIFSKAFRTWIAVVLVSMFFAYTHFKVPDMAVEMLGKSDSWWMGFYTAYWMLFGVSINFSWVPFLSLFVLGVLLCLIFLQTNSLLPCIGLHAGMVWARLSYIELGILPPHSAQYFWGTGRVIDGIIPLLGLAVICLYLLFYKIKKI